MNITPSQQTQNVWSDEAFRRFWKRMGDVFGLRWYEHNGPEPTASWKNGLSHYEIEHVMAAIVGYETLPHGGFPPNLPQFITEVRSARERYKPASKALMAPARTPEQIQRISAGLKSVREYTVKAAERLRK